MDGTGATHDVFVSYSSHDKSAAEAICTALEAADVACWIAPRNIRAGETWAEAIVDAIESSRLLLIVLSASANSSRQVVREVERAVNKGIDVLPIRIDGSDLSKSLEYFLSTAHWFDAAKSPLESHLPQIVRQVQGRLGEPLREEPAPTQPSEPFEEVDLDDFSGGRLSRLFRSLFRDR